MRALGTAACQRPDHAACSRFKMREVCVMVPLDGVGVNKVGTRFASERGISAVRRSSACERRIPRAGLGSQAIQCGREGLVAPMDLPPGTQLSTEETTARRLPAPVGAIVHAELQATRVELRNAT